MCSGQYPWCLGNNPTAKRKHTLWHQADHGHMGSQNSGLKLHRTGQWLSVLLCPTKTGALLLPAHPDCKDVCVINSMKRRWDATDGLLQFTQSGSGDNQCKRSAPLSHSDHLTGGPKLPSNDNSQNGRVWVCVPVHKRCKGLSVELKIKRSCLGIQGTERRKKKTKSSFLHSG